MNILFASGNEHKKLEMQELFKEDSIFLPKDFNLSFDCEENGSTFAENAMIKAKALFEIAKHLNMTILADDSGLLVEALPNLLGVKTARFGSPDGVTILPAHEKNQLLLKMLKDVPFEKRGATFVCSLAMIFPNGKIYTTEGRVNGYILNEETGEFGFGYDPVFFNLDANKPQAMLAETKNIYGHRGKAVRELKKLINQEK